MSSQAAKNYYEDETYLRYETRSQQNEQQVIGIAENLKEEFGDYSDPMTYDWTWRETD